MLLFHVVANALSKRFNSIADEKPSPELIQSFLEEATLISDFNHPNVLPTLGICWSRKDQPLVVLPYMANGDLKSLLRNEKLVSRIHKYL